MPRRIDHVDAAAQHGERDSLCRESAAVRRAVDALGQPAGDGEPALREMCGELEGGIAALRRGIAAADDGQLRIARAPRLPATYSAMGQPGSERSSFGKLGSVNGNR